MFMCINCHSIEIIEKYFSCKYTWRQREGFRYYTHTKQEKKRFVYANNSYFLLILIYFYLNCCLE